jgi:hypothetical protein
VITVVLVSAPTLWEEGRWPASRVTRLSIFALFVLALVDVIAFGRLTTTFDAGFALVCVAAALAIRPADFFRVGVLPPVLWFGFSIVLAIVDRGALGAAGDGLIQAIVAGLAHHAGALFSGYALCLVVLFIRQRFLAKVGVEADLLGPQTLDRYSNLAESPAPTLVTSGEPEVKSTTVVGTDPDSPAITASSN